MTAFIPVFLNNKTSLGIFNADGTILEEAKFEIRKGQIIFVQDVGEIWFDKSDKNRILLVKGNSEGRNIFVQTNQPANAQEGDIWFQTETEIPIE
jgi:hypothetical protein